MKTMLSFALAAAGLVCAAPASATEPLNFAVGIHQPDVYGLIQIGAGAPPALVFTQPLLVQSTPLALQRQPIYLYVPAQHQQHWPQYCQRYQACAQPVYFVHEHWVQERYRQTHPHWHGRHGGHRPEPPRHGPQGHRPHPDKWKWRVNPVQ